MAGYSFFVTEYPAFYQNTHGFYAVYSKVNSQFVFVNYKNPLVLHSSEFTG